jgi:uncharacterized protein
VSLLPSGAAYLEHHSALLVADAHFGKASSFRRLGVPVPEHTTQETLDRLSSDIALTAAQQLIFLGDFLHSRHAHAAVTQEALLAWRRQQQNLNMLLIRGNHDDKAGDPPASLGMAVQDEPYVLGKFALCHHPQPLTGHYTLAGHWHPCITLQGKARERLRLPCFWLGQETQHAVGILPAYGAFTGMHPIERRQADRVFAIGENQLFAV